VQTRAELEAAAHKAGIENENAWTDLQRAEATVIQLRFKQQVAALRALQMQMELARAARS
jgi:hypothetical protein